MSNISMNDADILSGKSIKNSNIKLLAYDNDNIYQAPINTGIIAGRAYVELTSEERESLANITDDNGNIINNQAGEIFNDYARNVASGKNSHAEGFGTSATSEASHTEGIGTKTNDNVVGQHVEGRYNLVNDNTIATRSELLHVVGNGVDDDHRSNAHWIDSSGTGWFNGRVISDDYIWSRQNGTGEWDGAIFADGDIFMRKNVTGANVSAGDNYCRVPMVFQGNGSDMSRVGKPGDIYCKWI